MPDPNANPCMFKIVCKSCDKVLAEDRPRVCKLMRCPHFTPCQGCNKNKDLDDNKLCDECRKPARAAPPTRVIHPVQEEEAISEDLKADLNSLEETLEDRLVSRGNFSKVVTPPGVPHPEFSAQEKEYYKMRWEEYHGYFRDPSAYPLCHNLIYIEIELNWLSNAIIFMRMDEADAGKVRDLERRQTALYTGMKLIRDQLPTKESQELTDDEKSMAMILEKHTKLRETRYNGGVSRLLSPGALALAPVLPFKVDPRDVLTKLGYKIVEIEEAIERIVDGRSLPRDPVAIAEALGMIIRDRITPVAKEEDLPESDEVEDELA